MDDMTSRQRVTTSLNHLEPDRVPFDCTFGYTAYTRLEKYLGFKSDREVLPGSPWLSVRPSAEFLAELGVDLFYLGLAGWGRAGNFEYGMPTYTDDWGIPFRKAENPTGVHYEFAGHPLANASIKELGDYPWPDPNDPVIVAGLEANARHLYENTDFALVGRFNNPIFEQAFMLRGMEQLYMDMALDPDFVGALMDILTGIAVSLIEVGMKACGKYLTILRLAGDDMGQQGGTLLSPAMFRGIIKPRFSRLYSEARRLINEYNPGVKLMAHTDGDVYPFIPDYIEMGLDVLNPVQPYVAEMEHDKLKHEFGERLSFHGGIDLQKVLPFGTPQEVRAEAIKTMRALGRGGGYILAPTHYLLPDVPPENVIALRDTVMEQGGYPLD